MDTMYKTDINLKNEYDLIHKLRGEAQYVKDCFTKYFYYGLLFSSTIIAFIVKYQEQQPLIALLSFLAVIFLFSIARIGIYKYTTANRNYGYQLYLERTRFLNDRIFNDWKQYMRHIGWEEAMFVWRFVQASIFHHLYETKKLCPNRLKKDHQGRDNWFELKESWENKDDKLEYHAGTYLKTMINILYLIIIISLIPLIVMLYQLHKGEKIVEFWICTIVVILLIIFVLLRIRRNNSKIKLLEQGILSISSCAVIWQAVVLAHYKALSDLNDKNNYFSYDRYMDRLSVETKNLIENIYEIDNWI
jgi:hypothetical protein